MSFFGFDPSGHNPKAPGFGQTHDPFAGLSNRNDDGDALDFEDTYDGLGDQLDETDDAFNDDTFGEGGPSHAPVGKDFDFFGATAKVADAFEEEQLRFSRQQPTRPVAPTAAMPATGYTYPTQTATQPARSGYEKYRDEPLPELQADAALWGMPKKHTPSSSHQQAPPQPAVAPSSKVMSLEEVEAAMRAQVKKPAQPAPVAEAQQQYPAAFDSRDFIHARIQQPVAHDPSPQEQQWHQEPPSQPGHGHPVTILQRPQSMTKQGASGIPAAPSPLSQIQGQQQQQQQQQQQPTQTLQNLDRLPGEPARATAAAGTAAQPTHPTHRPQNSFSRQAHVITHPSQLAHLTEDEKAAYLDQDTRRAKRNHKIFLMSKDNGMMTPQDKNFITRIQLQQLVSATGNPNELGTDESLAEDFYYQVYNQIRGGQRQHPSQPLNNFAQTYLYQTGSRQAGMRRHNRGPENHMQRMEQQVQRAVEAAKTKPKNKQLVIEGSLGKISFSNAKTPKPLLNIKHSDNGGDAPRPGSAPKVHNLVNGIDRRATLRNMEQVYGTLMQMEDHDRHIPPPPASDADREVIQLHLLWDDTANKLNGQLWRQLKFHVPIHEPIGIGPVHPFIAFISFSKGKKAIPRIFRHTTHEQRTTILTMIVVHLDQLDVIRGAQINTAEGINAAMREEITRFSSAVTNTLFNFMNELDLNIVAAILGLICQRDVDMIAKSRTGSSILTMILSRAEIIKHGGGGNEQAWQTWASTYDTFFNVLEPTLPHVFPGTVSSGEDIYVWQLLAAIGIGASPDQQQRLVLAVKDRVMDTVALSKTLPPAMASERLQNVNLFMRSIGLDVELLQ